MKDRCRYNLCMPAGNRFRHQLYPTTPAIAPRRLRLNAADGKQADFSKLHTDHGIHRVLLVHGTFLGDDPLGVAEILRKIGEGAPPLKSSLNAAADRISKATRDRMSSLAKDVANYCDEFREAFQQLVGDDPTIKLREPWSSQNHHVARANLAVQLFLELDRTVQSDDQRVLLWGHSHAGNGFAILSNLLANHHESVRRFFDAAGNQGDHWKEARQLLSRAPSPHPLAKCVDMVAFGTPVRYGFDTAGYRKLIHILHDRKPNAARPNQTASLFPPHSFRDMITAKYGDWVQAFAVAGTDVPTATTVSTHRSLGKVLTAGLNEPEHGLDTRFIVPEHVRDACARWKTGTRWHTDGLNLLCEYDPCGRQTKTGQPIEHSMFGHGVATTIEWLPTHLALVLKVLGE